MKSFFAKLRLSICTVWWRLYSCFTRRLPPPAKILLQADIYFPHHKAVSIDNTILTRDTDTRPVYNIHMKLIDLGPPDAIRHALNLIPEYEKVTRIKGGTTAEAVQNKREPLLPIQP